MTMEWSEQQRAIFSWFRQGAGNLVVRARAGTGKTTTIIEAIRHAPEQRILLCAFNKKIAMELERRAHPNVEVATLHSLGFRAVGMFWERIRTDEHYARRDALAREACDDRTPDAIVRLVGKLHTAGREMMPFATDVRDLRRLAYARDCVPDSEWAEFGYTVDWVAAAALRAMESASKTRPFATGIDYTDMLFLPVRNRWLRPRYDLVVVDECQDMNATQLLIAQGLAKGRVVVVGDDRQAIYGFRGADSDSLDRLKGELKATELGLTSTYRCGKVIVSVAAKIVPDFEAAPCNHDGEIMRMSVHALPAAVEVGDFVLSRKNAPLAKVTLGILRTGKRAKIEGRDIGAGLRALVTKLASGKAHNSMPEFLSKLTQWAGREIERAERSKDKGAETRIERIRDQAETLRVLAEGLSGVRELQVRIDDLFADTKGIPVVMCSSVHRAKGLEAERVFVLDATFVREVPCECGHWPTAHPDGWRCRDCTCGRFVEDADRLLEERNIEYVAITRAKSVLVRVDGLP